MDKEHSHSMGTRPMMHAGAMPAIVELMTEMWGLLTEEQKKKVAVMKIDMKIQWMETKINDMEKMIEFKKKGIANIRMVQEMIKTGK